MLQVGNHTSKRVRLRVPSIQNVQRPTCVVGKVVHTRHEDATIRRLGKKTGALDARGDYRNIQIGWER